MLGYLLAVVSSLFFSLYVVPRKLSRLQPVDFSLLMATGFFISSVVLYLFQPLLGFHEKLSPILIWSVLAGAVWAASFVTFVKAIDAIGLSRSNQWKNLQGPVAAVLSLILLAEYHITHVVFILFAAGAVFISAVAFTISESKEEAKLNLQGASLAALSGLGFGAVAVIQKHVTTEVGTYSQLVVWSLSILLSISVYVFHTKKKLPSIKISREVGLALLAGVLYLGASFFQLQSYNHLPASIAFTIVQLNTVWTIAIGILFFREISVSRHYLRLLVGLVFALVGILFLAMARR